MSSDLEKVSLQVSSTFAELARMSNELEKHKKNGSSLAIIMNLMDEVTDIRN